MQYQWFTSETPKGLEWTLRRNCVLTPSQLAYLFGVAGTLSIGVALGWASQGVWTVLPFALLETAGLIAAFVVYSRHAVDLDRVIIGLNRVEVEVVNGAKTTRMSYAAAQVRVSYGKSDADLVGVGEHGRLARIGRFVPLSERQRLAQEIAKALGVKATMA